MLYDLRVASLLQIMSPAYPRPFQVYHSYYLINLAGNGLRLYLYHLRLPVPGCGFYAPLRGFKTLRQELSDAL